MMKRNRFILLLCFLMLLPFTVFAQKEVRQEVKKGNQFFEKKQYDKAEVSYRKALETNSKDIYANYDLANTLVKTERGEEAAKAYNKLLENRNLLTDDQVADAAHNAGNLAMAVQDYTTAIDMYKASLRKRPKDEETRYNLALAQKLLKDQQQDGGGDDNKDNEQQEQNQDQNQDQQDQQNQQNQQQNKPQQQPDNGQKMSQDNAEKILEAYLQDEKDTQRKVEQMKQQQQKGKKSRPKNW